MEIPEIKSFYQNISAKIPAKLKNQIEGSIKSSNLVNFLNFFAELNFLGVLDKQNLSSKYEPQDGIDFELDSYAVSFKNLTDKEHIKNERKEVEKLLEESGKALVSKDFEYKSTKVKVTLETNGAYQRIVTGSFKEGETLKDDVQEKRKILENIALLENVTTSKKKVLFLFAQDETLDWEVEEICRWYFDLPPNEHDLVRPETYKDWFKSIKNKSVEAIIFARPFINGIYKLVWFNEIKPKIYTRDKDILKYFEKLFSSNSS